MLQRNGLASVVRRSWVDDLRDFRDLRYRYPAEFGVLADRCLVVCEVNAECAVASDIAVLPLNRWANLCDSLVRCPCGAAQFDDRHTTHSRYASFNQESFHLSHLLSPQWLMMKQLSVARKIKQAK